MGQNEEYVCKELNYDTFRSCVVQIVRVFKRPDGLKDTEVDAAGDGTNLN